MAINATSKSGSTFELVPAGTHVARCYSMCELGTLETIYMGEKKKQHKVRISFELPNELKVFNEEKGEQPFSVSKEFTLSMHEKSNLRKTLEGWRGKGFTEQEAENFDITKLLGIPCMLSIIHTVSAKDGKTYANIASVSALAKGMTCPEQINPNFEFSLSEFDEVKFNSLPDWLKDKIKSSDEYKAMKHPENQEVVSDNSGGSDEPENDLPFRYSPNRFKFNI